MGFGVPTIFGSAYSYEDVFSSINLIKNKICSQNLESSLKLITTSYVPDLSNRSRDMQGHGSY